MAAIEIPLLVISTLADGKKRVTTERSSATVTLAQLQRVLRGQFRELEIIDAGGNYFPRVSGAREGIAWRTYLQGGLFGPVGLVLDTLFLTVLVRVRFVVEAPSVSLTLSEIKNKVVEAIETNLGFYTHAPPEEIIGRVRSAKSVSMLIKRISRD